MEQNMADISIQKNHSLDVNTLKERLQKVSAELEKKFGLKTDWSGNSCRLSGTGLKSAEVSFDAATVSIEITLGMLGKALKPTIEKQIHAEFDKVIS